MEVLILAGIKVGGQSLAHFPGKFSQVVKFCGVRKIRSFKIESGL